MPDGALQALKAFVALYFESPGSDLLLWAPPDFQWEPPQLKQLRNTSLRYFAFAVNDIWLQLGRQATVHSQEHPQRHTLLSVPHALIVSGGRFFEGYYWDSFFVVIGLLRSGMKETACHMVSNLLHLVQEYGFVLNGNRGYYRNRSQPPLLTAMLEELSMEGLLNASTLLRSLPLLEKEYRWWMRTGRGEHAVYLFEHEAAPAAQGAGGHTLPPHPPIITVGDETDEDSMRSFSTAASKVYVLNRYNTKAKWPRPESWREDVESAKSRGYKTDPPDRNAERVFAEIAGAAESGWDFSSRFFADGQSLALSDTSRVIPADLNAILYGVERSIAKLARELASHFTTCCDKAASRSTSSRSRASCIGIEHHCSFYHNETAEKATAGGGGGGPSPSTPPCAYDAQALQLLSTTFDAAAERRMLAIERLLWDEEESQWRDLILPPDPHHAPPSTSGTPNLYDRAAYFTPSLEQPQVRKPSSSQQLHWSNITSASNFLPLFMGLHKAASHGVVGATERADRIAAALAASPLFQPGGIATTTTITGQQWDSPSGWAPINYMIIRGLASSGSASAAKLARELSRRWMRLSKTTFDTTGYMHEKYDVKSGGAASGGEYKSQVGFSWSNSVVLDLLHRYDFQHLEEEERVPA